MEPIMFMNQTEFHQWLQIYHENHSGIWIQFDKTRNESTLTAEEALDEALCFGWIDGQIKKINETYYMKYFAKRTPKSIWSTKNKRSIERLLNEGKIMPSGLDAVQSAKKDGRWDKADHDPIDFSLDDFTKILSNDQIALNNFLHMSPSVQKTYAISYYVLKKEETRQRRLLIILERLRNNLKPM